MPSLGFSELLIIGVIAVLLYGKRLPEVARSLGNSYTQFRKGLNEIQSNIHTATYTPPTYAHDTQTTSADRDEIAEPTSPKFEPPMVEASTVTVSEKPVA